MVENSKKQADRKVAAPSVVPQKVDTLLNGDAGVSTEPKSLVGQDVELTTLGRYEVLSELGRGGMGAVYLANDTILKRKVALKIPQFEPSKAEPMKARFRREAEMAAQLNHPNICQVYDVSEIDGRFVMAMEYIPGRTLATYTKPDKLLGTRQAVMQVRRVAQTMELAHQKGMIHRDLKPGNIMLCRPDPNRKTIEPKIMDFGLAKRAESQGEALTKTGEILGTPCYMSKEQWSARETELGPSVDIYSLGVILYELLTGHLPFDVHQEEPPTTWFVRLVTDRPTKPSQHKPDIDSALEQIVMKAIAVEAVDRYRSMAELATALEEWLKGKPAEDLPEPAVELASLNLKLGPETKTFARRKYPRSWPLIAAGFGGLAVLVLGIIIKIKSPDGTTTVVETEQASLTVTTPGGDVISVAVGADKRDSVASASLGSLDGFPRRSTLSAGIGSIDDDAANNYSETLSGLSYRILRFSAARRPTGNSKIKVHYRGWFEDGQVFDSSYEKGQPADFRMADVIAGWREGMQLIGSGGMIQLSVPPKLAFGVSGAAPAIPGNARLHFVIELVEVAPVNSPDGGHSKWTTLFDGADVSQWQTLGPFSVNDGLLTANNENGYAVSSNEYGDFEFEADWRIGEKGNSGIYYRELPSTTQSGTEYQIIDNDGYRDVMKPELETASLWRVVRPLGAIPRPLGEWNQTRIVCRGPLTQHWLNGTQVLEYDTTSSEWHELKKLAEKDVSTIGIRNRGHILLQSLGGEIAFRSIRIRELLAESPIPKLSSAIPDDESTWTGTYVVTNPNTPAGQTATAKVTRRNGSQFTIHVETEKDAWDYECESTGDQFQISKATLLRIVTDVPTGETLITSSKVTCDGERLDVLLSRPVANGVRQVRFSFQRDREE